MKMRKNGIIEFMKKHTGTNTNKTSFTQPYQRSKSSEAIYRRLHRQNFRLLISMAATLSLYVKPYANGLEPNEATLSAMNHRKC